MKTSLPRSALFMPGNNQRAITKAKGLACDAVILDLEDSVAPTVKDAARQWVSETLDQKWFDQQLAAVRTNELAHPEFTSDISVARKAAVVVVPKVSTLDELKACQDALQGSAAKLWVMIETPLGIINVREMAGQAARVAPSLQAFIIGANDLAKASGAPQVPGRWNMLPWFSEVVLAASAYGLGVLDSVSNNFRELEAFEAECEQGAALGMAGKTLIHPAQVQGCNRAFGPKAVDIERAEAIISAFEAPPNADKGAVQIDGEMVERLHLAGAHEILRRAAALNMN